MDTTPQTNMQPELPAPEEKLLRAPTFWEKYGWVNGLLFLLLIGEIGVVLFLVYSQ